MGKGFDGYRGYSPEELDRLINGDIEVKELDRYRDGLSLFAECLRDTRDRVIITLDGRDTAGKGHTIKKVTEYFNTFAHDVVNFPGVPTPEEKRRWFDRYSARFPKEGNMSIFDRSWYNRALVEPVMDFCTPEEYEWFEANVCGFEESISSDKDNKFRKIYLSINKQTQKERLEKRNGIRRRWKSSQVDKQAQGKWSHYDYAVLRMLENSHTDENPWHVIDANNRHPSVLEVIKLIIKTNEEIASHVSSELDLDLSMDEDIYRTGDEEIKRRINDGRTGKAFDFVKES